MNLWLDDIRPGPPGWTWVKTVEEAKKLLETGQVVNASLDHDLGACEACLNGRDIQDWMEDHNFKSQPNCTHVGTGYDLVCWMEEHDIWPQNKPNVHSANPVGRMRMWTVIDTKFGGRFSLR